MKPDKLRVYAQNKLKRYGPDASALVWAAELEALLDMVDAARRHLSDQAPGCRCEHEMADALARLDGDSGGAA